MEKQKVALVLSSGGARGIAHVSVIEEIERRGFEITSVAGASMGALVGGMYASGHLSLFKDWLMSLDKRKMLNLSDLSFSNDGLVKGDKLIKELKQIIPDMNIEDCRIPYTALASDIKNSEEVVFNSGNLYDAMRASISIPAFFKPYKMQNRILVDGGVLNPLPIKHITRTDHDLLIAVDVCSRIGTQGQKHKPANNKSGLKIAQYFPFTSHISLTPKESEGNYITLLTGSAAMMIQQITALTLQLYPPDLLIPFPMKLYSPFDFFKFSEILENGTTVARAILDDYQSTNQSSPQ